MQQQWYTTDELMHYGVLGMKWGIKRGNVDKAYAKASKKLQKIDKSIQKNQQKARKLHKKTDGFDIFRNYHTDKANRKTQKAVQKMKKAERWVKNMEKAFKDTSVSLTKEQVAIGKKYADMLNTRSAIVYYR